MVAYEGFMLANFGATRLRDQNFTDQKSEKSEPV